MPNGPQLPDDPEKCAAADRFELELISARMREVDEILDLVMDSSRCCAPYE